ncbi:MAG: hypothetical protein CL424_00765 [Acidimicrobiaceae bacterium]|nr:hypothetical protein [Acidimicrobiaceae bacterium]
MGSVAHTDPGTSSTESSTSSMTTIERRAAARKAARTNGSSTNAPDEPNTVIWWHVANVIDLVHFPIVIALVVLGAVYFSGPVFVFLLTLMVTLQVATLGCPVMWLTGQLRKVHDPDYEVKWSFTAWLYQTYGRWFGVAVFVFFAGLTLLLRFLLF